jgi:hypothetical protein
MTTTDAWPVTDEFRHADWLDELRRRFGDSPSGWAFTCPHCGDVATGADFKAALEANPVPGRTASSYLGQSCIGRVLGALREKRQQDWTGRGCDWTASGLFRGPVRIIPDDGGGEMFAFRMADPTSTTTTTVKEN